MKSKILDLPVIRQSTTYTCNCTCLQAILCYYGIDQRENQLAKLMNVTFKNSDEVHPKKIMRAAAKFGLKTEYRKMSIADLRNYIDKGIPIIVNFQAWSPAANPKYGYGQDKNGHYAVVIGYNTKNLIFSDPASFYKTCLPYGEFATRWHDGDTTDSDYSNMGIIIYGKTPMYNRRLIKKTE